MVDDGGWQQWFREEWKGGDGILTEAREYVKEEWREIPPGQEVQAELRDVQEMTTERGTCLKWLFALCDAQYGDRLVSKLTPTVLHERNPFDQVLSGLGCEVEKGAAVVPADLVGTKVVITLKPLNKDGFQPVDKVTRPLEK